MTDEETDAQIAWLPLVSIYYWMAYLDTAKIGDTDWPITVQTIIFDSGSSINHIPTREYNILLNQLTKDHVCKSVMNPLETYYCECTGVDDPTFPVLTLTSGNVALNFKPIDYLVYEKIDMNDTHMCMISFQEETRPDTTFWLLGDSFLRAFYTIYDFENRRIGLVGDTVILSKSAEQIVTTEAPDEGIEDSEEFNLLIYILPGVLCLLCFLAICLSACITYRLRKRQNSL